MDYQVIVIGAGPGGYPAALRAARMGARVCIVEPQQVGGTCLNRGCIPTKALVESASALRHARQGRGIRSRNRSPLTELQPGPGRASRRS